MLSPSHLDHDMQELPGRHAMGELDTREQMDLMHPGVEGKRLRCKTLTAENGRLSGAPPPIAMIGVETVTSNRQERSRQVANGKPTNDLVFSAHTDGNDDVFPRILGLYVAPGSTVADVTYGKGVFWKRIPKDLYKLKQSDIIDGIDCRDLPYKDGEIDCVVLDPPYMHSPGGTAHTMHSAFERHYRNNGTGNRTGKKYHEAVLSLYEDATREAHRVLRERGVLIVKCQDEVCANRQRFTHVEIMGACERIGFVAEDLFVVVRQNRPGVSRTVRQVHARKNHSYFLVFWKRTLDTRIWEPPQ